MLRTSMVLVGLPAAAHHWLLQQSRKPAVLSVALLWSGRIRSTTLTAVIPQSQLPQLCEDVCRRSDSRHCQPGAASCCLCRRRWSDLEQPHPWAESQGAGAAGNVAVPAAGLFLAPFLLWKDCCFTGVCSEAVARAQQRRWGKKRVN